MGYLNNSSVTIDAILTIKGRELLAQGADKFKITQFALGDDEVDYTLWNTDHPLGTAYYGTIIENMPVLEAIPDETQALRSKLVTLPKGAKKIPIVSVGATTLILKNNETAPIKPATTNIANANVNLGYTAIISDNTVLGVRVVDPIPGASSTATFYQNSDASSISVVGRTFEITGLASTLEDKSATVTIVGNETGGSVSIAITVKRVTL